ncbi:transglycosylase domain-containing protein [Selenomonadales bacterium OttesenSCG-928-I06]|nr:transglycosylase domain-containing protein [Selenomonadales bacterium OttesenSCG-928-I06]
MRKSFLSFLLFLIILFFAFLAGSFFLTGGSLKDFSLDDFKDYKPAAIEQKEQEINTYASRFNRFIDIKSEVDKKINKNTYISLDDMPFFIKYAVIAAEDKRFYSHFGVDMEGIARASLVNIQEGEIVQGGSSITQQLAKNLFLSNERSYFRKGEEVVLALLLENNYTKDEILEIYLNSVYFGSGAYGISEASYIYFDKNPIDLNLAECAMIAGLLTAPSLNSPYVDFDAAKRRQALVLDAMAKQSFISPELAAKAKTVNIRLKKDN